MNSNTVFLLLNWIFLYYLVKLSGGVTLFWKLFPIVNRSGYVYCQSENISCNYLICGFVTTASSWISFIKAQTSQGNFQASTIPARLSSLSLLSTGRAQTGSRACSRTPSPGINNNNTERKACLVDLFLCSWTLAILAMEKKWHVEVLLRSLVFFSWLCASHKR